MTTGTFQSVQQIESDLNNLVRQLALDLQSDMLRGNNPAGTARTARAKYDALCRKLDQEANLAFGNTGLKQWIDAVKATYKGRIDKLVAAAESHHAHRNRAQDGLKGKYNEMVGQGLAQYQQGGKALNDQVDRLVRRMIDQVVTDPKVPGNVRDEMARSLAGWVKQQEFYEDAFFAIQGVLGDVSVWLSSHLTFQAQVDAHKQQLKGRTEITTTEANAADQSAGALARQRNELDRQIQQRIEASVLRVSPVLKFNPNLVLDPGRMFIRSLDAQAGIVIRQNDVKIELGTRLRLTDPALDSRALNVNPYVNVNVGNNFNVSGSYESNTQFNTGQRNEQWKVQLSWRF